MTIRPKDNEGNIKKDYYALWGIYHYLSRSPRIV